MLQATALPRAVVIVALTLIAYVPAIRGGYVWDDDLYLIENPALKSMEGLRQIWFEIGSTPQQQFWPMTYTTFWIEYRLWGLHPLGYHLVNVLLHASNAVLVWLILARLRVPGAWMAAAVFAFHPVHVESVAWITERKNVLSGFFYLGAMLAYFRCTSWAHPTITAASPNPVRDLESARHGVPHTAFVSKWYYLSLFLFASSLFTKTVTCSFPVAILLLVWWKRGRVVRSDVLAMVPYFVLGLILGLTTVWVERHHVGTQGEQFDFSVVERMLIASRALWFYVGKLAWPFHLSFIYPRWKIDPHAAWQYVFLIAAIAVPVFCLWARSRTGSGPLVGILFFSTTLAPALGFINIYTMRFSFVADHFQYLASLGLIPLGVAGIVRALHRSGQSHRLGRAVGLIVLLGLGMLTWRQGGHYKDLETLWNATLVENPGSWMVHSNLAQELEQTGKLDEALRHHRMAAEYDPNNPQLHYNLGTALFSQGAPEQAIVHLRRAVRLEDKFVMAYANLGTALLHLDRSDEALTHLNMALRLSDKQAHVRHSLGVLFESRGKTDDAFHHFSEALRIDPQHANAHVSIGGLLQDRGQLDAAIHHYRQAVQIQPDHADAHNNLGTALARAGKLQEAVNQLRDALKIIDPVQNAKIHFNLGSNLQSLEDTETAMRHFRESLQINPNLAPAHYRLGHILALQGFGDQAAAHLKRAVEIEPNHLDTLYLLGVVLEATGRGEEALEFLQKAQHMQPASDKLLSLRAWILATHLNVPMRNEEQALSYAERAVNLTDRRDMLCLDALAAAYAAAGNFVNAVATASEALDLAPQHRMAEAIRARLELYQRNRSYSKPAATEIPQPIPREAIRLRQMP